MITKAAGEGSFAVMPEESDDLMALRRVVEAGDVVAGSTTRAVKREGEYARPDRGERVRVRIALSVEAVSLDSTLGRLRMRGTISESDNEAIPHGVHHSLLVQAGDRVTITKKAWSPVHARLVGRGGGGGRGFVLAAIDSADCGVARLAGTRLTMAAGIRSGAGGKRYKTAGFSMERYLDEAAGAIAAARRKGDAVVVFGPGETKRRLRNRMLEARAAAAQRGRGGGAPAAQDVLLAEGVDTGGEDGIRSFTGSEAMRDAMGDSKMAAAYRVIDEVMLMASRRGRKFAMGYEETRRASRVGAVDSLVFSDGIMQAAGEQEAVDMLNEAEAGGGKALSVDSTTDAGSRVSGMGGVVATLRFPVGG